jgi:hypothetical protein
MGGNKQTKTKEKTDNGQLLLTMSDKRQTRYLVREGAQQRQHSEIQTELISGHKSQGGLDAKTYWLTDSRNVISGLSRSWQRVECDNWLTALASTQSFADEKPAVGSHYQETASIEQEDFMCTVIAVIFEVCNSVRL